MADISYAIIALKLNQVSDVAKALREKEMAAAADWLEGRKDQMYGPGADDWRPFGGKTLDEMLNENGRHYTSGTGLIDSLSENLDNIDILFQSNIELFFIDVFTSFMARSEALAHRLDLALAGQSNVCLVVPYGLSPESVNLIMTHQAAWKVVRKAYEDGYVHPILLRPEDVIHAGSYFFNQLRPEGGADPQNNENMNGKYSEREPAPRTNPRLVPRKKRS